MELIVYQDHGPLGASSWKYQVLYSGCYLRGSGLQSKQAAMHMASAMGRAVLEVYKDLLGGDRHET